MLLAVLLVTAGCGDDGDPERRPVRPIATDDPAAAFAPLVGFAQGEKRWPMSAARFIDYSSFKWQNSPCVIDLRVAIGVARVRQRRIEGKPATVPARLGGRRALPYRVAPSVANCDGSRAVAYRSNQHTRPYDAGRPAGLRTPEGFYLDLPTPLGGGQRDLARIGSQAVLRGVPVYYEQARERGPGRDGLRITYWMLFGYHSPEPARAGFRLQHEGDWERVSVLLREARRAGAFMPVSVRYHQDGRSVDVPWATAELASDAPRESHPMVYIARGSHTPYPDAGSHAVRRSADGRDYELEDVTEACDDCPQWRTWTLLRPVRAEPWYGYGGAWGRVFLDGQRSGPLGPSPFVAASSDDGMSEEQRVERAAAGLHDDVSHRRFREVCALLARRPQVQVGSVGHNRRPTTCRADLEQFVNETGALTGAGRTPRPLDRSPRPKVMRVVLSRGGARAAVTMEVEGGDPYVVPFVKEDGQWKLDDFFGATGPTTPGLR